MTQATVFLNDGRFVEVRLSNPDATVHSLCERLEEVGGPLDSTAPYLLRLRGTAPRCLLDRDRQLRLLSDGASALEFDVLPVPGLPPRTALALRPNPPPPPAADPPIPEPPRSAQRPAQASPPEVLRGNESITTVADVCGCTQAEALLLLKDVGGDVNRAVDLYYRRRAH
jgi:hypothetical protein